jgi:hypothetical protein
VTLSPVGELINIVAWDQGGGIAREVDLLSKALALQGWRVAYNGRLRRGQPSFVSRVSGRLSRDWFRIATRIGVARPPFAANLFIESIAEHFIPLGRVNVLLPHPEWFRESYARLLPQMDWVFALTHHAQPIFESRGARVKYLGFTCPDRGSDGKAWSRPMTALHIAGASLLKGTEVILDVWSRHPDWPRLHVLRSPLSYDGVPMPWHERVCPANVSLVTSRLTAAEVSDLQDSIPIHICTSESEGFGQIIAEAMSAGAVVITTDAPPMNELVGPDRGILVAVDRSEPLRLGTRYFVDVDDLERKIDYAVAMPPQERARFGRAAQEWFRGTDAEFPSKLGKCLRAALAE